MVTTRGTSAKENVFSESPANESLTTVFRSLSLKRRQGVLEILTDETSFELVFQNGKIVDAGCSSEHPSAQVCDKLVCAGLLLEGIRQKVTEVEISLAELYSVLVGQHHVSPDDFRK